MRVVGMVLVAWAAAVFVAQAEAQAPPGCSWKSDSARTTLWCTDDKGKEWNSSFKEFDEQTIPKAEAGDPRSMTLLGAFYAASAPDNLKDGAAAFGWFSKAADKGEPGAMFGLGYLYQHGVGLPKNSVTALHWLEKSADAGSVPATFWTAAFYEHGVGVAKDEPRALAWYRRAADKSDMGAMGALSLMYREGRGTPVDTAEADKWWDRFVAAESPASETPESLISALLYDIPSKPANVLEFVHHCMAHYGGCSIAVSVMGINAMFANPRSGCGWGAPKDPSSTTKAVLGWLVKRQETYDMSVRDGILAAYARLWPC